MGTAHVNYQMLCIDVDGTLLNSHGEITEGNRLAVRAAVAAGKKVVLCSGRTWHSLKFYEHTLGLDIAGQYGIGFNGGAVYEILNANEKRAGRAPITEDMYDKPPARLAAESDSQSSIKLLHSELMPRSIAQEIFAAFAPIIAQYNEMHILAYNYEGFLIAEERMQASRLFDEMRKLGARLVPAYADMPGDVYKILVHGERKDLLEIADFSCKRFNGKCQVMFSAHSLLELIPMGVDKGQGIAFLAGHLGIPMEAVIAMGDEGNDIAMLHKAGLGIAVANAVPAAREAADICLPQSNNDDAVSAAIHQYLL